MLQITMTPNIGCTTQPIIFYCILDHKNPVLSVAIVPTRSSFRYSMACKTLDLLAASPHRKLSAGYLVCERGSQAIGKPTSSPSCSRLSAYVQRRGHTSQVGDALERVAISVPSPSTPLPAQTAAAKSVERQSSRKRWTKTR